MKLKQFLFAAELLKKAKLFEGINWLSMYTSFTVAFSGYHERMFYFASLFYNMHLKCVLISWL